MESSIFELALQQGLGYGLFVWLLYRTQKKADEREDKLMSYLNEANKQQEKIAISMEKLELRLEKIEEKIESK